MKLESIAAERVRVMFIQSQHSNTSGGVALQHIHKKRRLDHHQQQVDYSNGDNLYALNAGGIVNNLNQTVVQRHVQRTLNTNNNVQNKSPNGGVPQQFIRASTIKLLDTYQRCGQKEGVCVSVSPVNRRVIVMFESAQVL
uniref:Uncharacterized protein n=2 Tax=Timema TaxID=61471 RepID=A0A7R9P2B6_9NEOP|nr:unnamed protein product [Timema tahoe]